LRKSNRCSSSLGIVVEEPINRRLLAPASQLGAQQSQNSLYFSLLMNAAIAEAGSQLTTCTTMIYLRFSRRAAAPTAEKQDDEGIASIFGVCEFREH
jgi:hypothetical protein